MNTASSCWVRPARTRTRAAASLLLLALALAACGHSARPNATGSPSSSVPDSSSTSQPVARVPVGSSSQTIVSGGRSRTFRIYRPAHLPARAPLVVMLHGGFGSALEAERSYGWDGEADARHFVVVYPDGFDHAWNTGGGCCGKPAAEGINDVAFISQVVSTVEEEIPIDANRVYATGISNGGIMAYTLACKTRIFAAIGPDSATELGPCPSPAPLSVIHIHGTADTHIPYEGGEGDGTAHIDGPAIPALNAEWRAIDHCAAPAVTRGGVVTTSVATCPGGRSVELITIAGAGHQWPGSAYHPARDKILGLDPPSKALNATSVIWQFFEQHPK